MRSQVLDSAFSIITSSVCRRPASVRASKVLWLTTIFRSDLRNVRRSFLIKRVCVWQRSRFQPIRSICLNSDR